MTAPLAPAWLGLGLAAAGRPAYITSGRARDLGAPADRSVEALRARAFALLDTAWELGIRVIDAARSYGRAEFFLGDWLEAHPGRREHLTIGSKWGYEYVGGWRLDAAVHERKDHSPAMLARQWPATLAALRTTPDLYLIHSVTPESPALDDPDLLHGLRELRSGGCRVGLSTSGPHQAAVLDRALALPASPFSAVQSTWNVREQSATDSLRRAHDHGWFVAVKEALANGRLVPGADARVDACAAQSGQAADAFAIGAAAVRTGADVVLSGAVIPEQLRENAAARVPETDPAVIAALAEPPAEYWSARTRLPWT